MNMNMNNDMDTSVDEEVVANVGMTVDINYIPNQVFINVMLPCLKAKDLANIALLSKRFYRLANNDTLWRHIVKSRWVPRCTEEDYNLLLNTFKPEIHKDIYKIFYDIWSNDWFGFDSMLELIGAKKLELSRVSAKKANTALRYIKNLTNLDIELCYLDVLPPNLQCWDKLEKLNLTSNSLTVMPLQIYTVANLRMLDIGYNELTEIPEAFYTGGHMVNLTDLVLSGNSLGKISRNIGKLGKLESLTIDEIGLDVLPEEIGRLTALKNLSMNENNLTVLPSSIKFLENLILLHVRENQLVELPEEIRDLRLLEDLDIYNNNFERFPVELCYADNLCKLKIDATLDGHRFDVRVDGKIVNYSIKEYCEAFGVDLCLI